MNPALEPATILMSMANIQKEELFIEEVGERAAAAEEA
jgi:hypothetical protein